MTKSEFLKVLIPELERLKKVEHLESLAINRRDDEAQKIIDEIDYSSMHKYMENEEKERISTHEIPEEYLETYVFYLWGSGYSEVQVMESWEDFQEALDKLGHVGKVVAEKMDYYCLSDIRTIVELVKADDEEDAVD